MRKNEYESLEQFTLQYIGEWGPSDGREVIMDDDTELVGQDYVYQMSSRALAVIVQSLFFFIMFTMSVFETEEVVCIH